jgi:hypothetical protein
MRALFPRWANTAYRLALGALVSVPVVFLLGLMLYVRTPWATGHLQPLDQPVEFDHRHHVQDDGIECLYCHSGAEKSDFAGVPSTDVCMGCHAQIWSNSPLLEVVRRSYFSDRPLAWNRVHDLGDFTYFNHAVHVQRGLGCVLCHGRVDRMARVFKSEALTMGFCLECHRDPAAFLRQRSTELASRQGPRSLWGQPVTSLLAGFSPAPARLSRLTTCSACHR